MVKITISRGFVGSYCIYGAVKQHPHSTGLYNALLEQLCWWWQLHHAASSSLLNPLWDRAGCSGVGWPPLAATCRKLQVSTA